jgi:hypothetical protein
MEEHLKTEWGRMWNDVALAYCEILLQLALEKIRKATKINFFIPPSVPCTRQFPPFL